MTPKIGIDFRKGACAKTKVLQRPKDARRCSVEDLVHGGFPSLAKKLASEVLSMPENVLRIAGLVAMALGVGIVWAGARLTMAVVLCSRGNGGFILCR
jgi:uncharacterized protein YjeT (DUF2065 family)